VTVLAGSDPLIPENLEKVPGPGLVQLSEVLPKTKLIKEPSCAGSVGIPATPDTMAIGLSRGLQEGKNTGSELKLIA